MARRKEPTSRLGLRDSDLLKTARARFQFAEDADTEQRQRERDDLAFYAGDQWPADVRLARQGQQPTTGMPAVPSRPTLVINNVREPVRQISNEAASADLGIEITPAEDFGDLNVVPDEAEIALREGLVRKIQRESQARDARMWAYDRAVKSGRGYYLIGIRFLPGKTWDQEIYIARIYNQAQVLLDPSHDEPDGCDAKWGFLCTDMLWDDYCAEFPDAADGSRNRLANTITDSEWQVLGEDYPKWFTLADGTAKNPQKTRSVRIVDYWYTDYDERELCVLTDGSVVWRDELPTPLPTGLEIADSRWESNPVIRWCKIDGAQVLQKMDWPGPDLPIVKVLGEELQPYDGERRVEGMVRPARDSQMGLNYMISKQVEMVGLTPIPPIMTDPDAIEGYEAWYGQMNTRTLPYLPYRTYDDQGRPLKEPHRPNVEPNLLPVSQSIALFSAQIEKTTAVPAARLGDIDPVTRSGKALDRLTANSQKSTSNFMMNLVRSVRREGEILNNLLYPIYGKVRDGRLVRTMTSTGTSDTMLIHSDPVAAQKQAALMQRASAVARLTPEAKFNTNIKVTRDYDTRKQEEHAVIGELIAAAPNLMTVLGDLFFSSMDSPGHQEMAERMRVTLAPPVQQLLAAKAAGQAPPTPRELQLQAENAQLKKVAQEMHGEIATDMLSNRTKVQIESMRQQGENERAALDRETKLAVAEVQALAKEMADTRALFAEERARLGSQQHEAVQAAAERDIQRQQMAHDAASQHTELAVQAIQPPEPANGVGARE